MSIRGTSYYTFVGGGTWTEVEDLSISLGGNLVAINDSEENQWLHDNDFHGWIGFTDRETEGDWKWSNGDPVTFVSWFSGQPDNVGNEDYASKSSTFWGDSNNSGYGNGGLMKGVAEIPLSYFSISDLSLDEGDSGNVIISRTGGTNQVQNLTISSSNGTATSGLDYTAVSETITFSSGETSKIISISALSDNSDESDETFNLTLSASTSDDVPAQITDSSSIVTIQNINNNKLTGSIRGTSYYTFVGGGTWTEVEDLSISLGGNLVAINDSEENQWLHDNDFHGWIGFTDRETEGDWKWSNGDPVTFVSWFSGQPDNVGNEDYASKSSTFWGDSNNSGYGNGGLMKGVAEIPLSYFSISDLSLDEGDSGNVIISRTGGTNQVQNLTISSSNGTATSGLDYTAVSETITFSSGETSKIISISALSDNSDESDETFNLTLSASTSDDVPAQITDSSSIVTIQNINNNKLTGTPLAGSISQGSIYSTYEGEGGDVAIKDFNLIDNSGDNTINATNKIDSNHYYYSFAIDSSDIQTGEGDDTFNIKNYRGIYAIGLKDSKISSGGGADKINIDLLEDNFLYGAFGLEDSEINTGSGNDEIVINVTSSKNNAFTSYVIKNSKIELGDGDDSLIINKENSSSNLDIAISGKISYAVDYEFGAGNDTGTFTSDGYGLQGSDSVTHKVTLGEGNDIFTINSKYSALYKSNLFANSGADQIRLTASSSLFYGIDESNIYLGDNDDVITVDSSKNSVIYGGLGYDELIILGNYSDFRVTNNQENTATITKNGDGLFKLDVYGLEKLSFNDKTILLDLDLIAPTISSSSPTDDSADVAKTSNIVLNFSEVVDVETGNIVIYKASDDSVVETIDVTSSQVTGTGSTQIIVNPSSDLTESTSYYVQIAATAFDDASSNSYAGISDTTTLNFTTYGQTKVEEDEGNSSSTYRIFTSINAPQENYLLTTTAQTSNVSVGTKLYWSISGEGISAEDFASGSLNGEGTIGSDGSFSFEHFLADDGSVEGYETINIKLFSDNSLSNQVGITKSILIRDSAITEQLAEINSKLNSITELLTKGQDYTLTNIRDYDGNLHANTGEVSEVIKTSYKYQGLLDVNNDDTKEAIYTNRESGRWVTASVNSTTGFTDYSNYGKGGTTRVVGIYIDPLVTSGEVIQGSDFDSQRRFQNDLQIDNLLAKTAGDYDGDGFQEVYWKTTDDTAYLRALMHADGNIQYANYQSEEQMSEYLTAQGYESVISEII